MDKESLFVITYFSRGKRHFVSWERERVRKRKKEGQKPDACHNKNKNKKDIIKQDLKPFLIHLSAPPLDNQNG